MEAISVAKAIEEKKDYSINPNQELIALGASNIVGSLFQSYPLVFKTISDLRFDISYSIINQVFV
jgi:MFS superfamily sulfate permease-like transporter